MKSNYIGDRRPDWFEHQDESDGCIGAIIVILFLIFVGYLIPVPSPFELYKRHQLANIQKATQHKKAPTRVAPPIKPKEIFVDLNEDGEPEWYMIQPIEVDTNLTEE